MQVYVCNILRIQVSVKLPSTEVDESEQKDCYAPAMHWADVFWSMCLQRCASSRIPVYVDAINRVAGP